jgi:predicted  nucleic acid-binding Zn-ribbon protein
MIKAVHPLAEASRRSLETRPALCLWCGEVYEKPLARRIRLDDPGCPACGYVGWAEAAPPRPAATD